MRARTRCESWREDHFTLRSSAKQNAGFIRRMPQVQILPERPISAHECKESSASPFKRVLTGASPVAGANPTSANQRMKVTRTVSTMKDKLTSPSVLALNANWQAIDVYTPQKAFCMMASGAAAGLDTSNGSMVPVHWDHWICLPGEDGAEAAMTARGPIRIPRVIIAINYKRLRIKTEPLTHEVIARRQDFRCAYTGRSVRRKNWSLDHVIPKSRGGSSSWDNLVIADRDVNSRKGDRTPTEAGLQLLHKPRPPRRLVPCDVIRQRFGILFREWEPFVK